MDNDNYVRAMDAWADAFIAYCDSDAKPSQGHPSWWAYERTMKLPLERHADEEMWAFVLAVLAKSPSQLVLSHLAAGPLEDLIAYGGEKFIDRIELHARRDPAFRHLLGGVWQNRTPAQIWARLEAARGAEW